MFFAFLLGCSVVNVGGNAEDFFPIKGGNTWVYEVTEGSRVDTLSWKFSQLQQDIYIWENNSKFNGENTTMGATIVDGIEPFDDSVIVIVDSILIWSGANTIIPLDPENTNQISLPQVKTKYAVYDDCIFVQGTENADGKRFDVWLARDIGPVKVEEKEHGKLVKEFHLLDFYSVK